MNLTLSGKNLHIPEVLRAKVETKVGKLDKYLKPDTEVHTTLSSVKGRNTAEVTILLKGVVMRAEETTYDNMLASVEQVIDKLEHQIHKHRTKLEKKFHSSAFHGYEEEVDEFEDDASLVRVKQFSLKPMSVDEALLQMDLLSHSFFVFHNDETEKVNVVYKRKDGNYGLIEPG